jgi:hypothetical protein
VRYGPVLMLSALVASAIVLGSAIDRRPRREDCIVVVAISGRTFEAEPSMTKHSLSRAIVAVARSMPDMPMPALAFPQSRPSVMYMQFPTSCEQRFILALQLTRGTAARVEGVTLEVSYDRVKPGPDTVDIVGPMWAD